MVGRKWCRINIRARLKCHLLEWNHKGLGLRRTQILDGQKYKELKCLEESKAHEDSTGVMSRRKRHVHLLSLLTLT